MRFTSQGLFSKDSNFELGCMKRNHFWPEYKHLSDS